jgi:hypothetical protein
MKKKEEKEKLLRKYSSYLTKNLFLPWYLDVPIFSDVFLH